MEPDARARSDALPSRPADFQALQTSTAASAAPNLGLLVSPEDLRIYQHGKNRRKMWRDIKLLGSGAEGESCGGLGVCSDAAIVWESWRSIGL